MRSMLRITAALAFMVGTDILLFDGKYTRALSWVGFGLLHAFDWSRALPLAALSVAAAGARSLSFPSPLVGEGWGGG